MPRIAGVRFRRPGRVHFCDADGLELKVGDRVVVATGSGLELGSVVVAPEQVVLTGVLRPTVQVVRKATAEDLQCQEELQAKARAALASIRGRITSLGLSIRPVEAEYTLDGQVLVLYCPAISGRALTEAARLEGEIGGRVEVRRVGPEGKGRQEDQESPSLA